MPRRCFWIRLDARRARPWQGRTFRHPDLLGWAAERRGELLLALLTLARGWWAAGQPDAGVQLGGFDAWARVVGGILAHAGVHDFLDNLTAMYDQIDDDGPAWEAFIRALAETFGDQAFRTADVVAAVESDKQLAHALPDEFDTKAPLGSLARRLGKAFSKRRDVRYGKDGVRLTAAADDTHAKVNRWSVETAGLAGDGGFPCTHLEEKREDRTEELRVEGPLSNPLQPASPAERPAPVCTCGEPGYTLTDDGWVYASGIGVRVGRHRVRGCCRRSRHGRDRRSTEPTRYTSA